MEKTFGGDEGGRNGGFTAVGVVSLEKGPKM